MNGTTISEIGVVIGAVLCIWCQSAWAYGYGFATVATYHYVDKTNTGYRLNPINPGIGYVYQPTKWGVGGLVYYNSYRKVAETAFVTRTLYHRSAVVVTGVAGVMCGYTREEYPATYHRVSPMLALTLQYGYAVLIVTSMFATIGFRYGGVLQ